MIDENKMYVVVGVLLIILLGLFLYLITIDVKLRKIEKRHNKENKPKTRSTVVTGK
ncbi:MAG TPA: hypothetical protein PK908_02885 [Bacteroidales bacterium]|nr:hypothetical protein [Bacteroidales bacterium]